MTKAFLNLPTILAFGPNRRTSYLGLRRRYFLKPFGLYFIMIGASISNSVLGTTNEPVRLLVPDGQLRSHPIRVFLDRDITTAMKPTLTLIASHALLNQGRRELTTNSCSFLAR